MTVNTSNINDFEAWLSLAKEVEPLFGSMCNEKGFQSALKDSIKNKEAYCIYSIPDNTLVGGIIISKELNEILWLAVSENFKRNGYGKELLAKALSNLNTTKRILVQTFDKSVPAGKAARKLYLNFGFHDYKSAENNPAGIPTVIMCKEVK